MGIRLGGALALAFLFAAAAGPALASSAIGAVE